MVKIDSDIADFFGSPEAVNQALRLLIDAARVVKLDAVKPAEAQIEPETAAQLYPADIDPPDPGIYIPSREYQTDGFPITFLVTYRGYGDLHKILSFVFGFLITHSR